MRSDHVRISWLTGLAFFSLWAALPSSSFSQTPAPAEVLKSQGLKRSSSSTWLLPTEAAALKDFRVAKGLAGQLQGGQQQQQALEMGNLNPKAMTEAYHQQLDLLEQEITMIDQELAKLGPPIGNAAADTAHNLMVTRRNSIVAEQRRLGGAINNVYDNKQQFDGQKKQFDTEVARLREAYMDAVEALRKSVDTVQGSYAELRNSDDVTKALADLSSLQKSRQRLGPSSELLKAIQWLSKAEGFVQKETIDLHREGGVDHIDALLNGKSLVRMVFDTGAGPTTLPAVLASELRLRPTGRSVSLQTADGTTVSAREMLIASITVGRLTVKNVVCAVMPKEKGDVAPLLGQSFLRHFDYKYTQGSGQLILTRAEPDAVSETPKIGPGKK